MGFSTWVKAAMMETCVLMTDAKTASEPMDSVANANRVIQDRHAEIFAVMDWLVGKNNVTTVIMYQVMVVLPLAEPKLKMVGVASLIMM